MSTRNEICASPALTEVVRDICAVVIDNPDLRHGMYLARAQRLAEMIDEHLRRRWAVMLGIDDLSNITRMAEAVALFVVNRQGQIVAQRLTMRVCERAIEVLSQATGAKS